MLAYGARYLVPAVFFHNKTKIESNFLLFAMLEVNWHCPLVNCVQLNYETFFWFIFFGYHVLVWVLSKPQKFDFENSSMNNRKRLQEANNETKYDMERIMKRESDLFIISKMAR